MPWYPNRNGDRLWYEDAGDGCPIVLLHGWCMSSAVWKYQLGGLVAPGFAPLSPSLRMLAPDLRGHGLSQPVSGRVDFTTLADDLIDLFDFLGLENAVLVGWSLGGQIALQAYEKLAKKCAGLVLVSATPRFTASDDFPYGLVRTEADGMRLKVQRSLERALGGFHSRLFVEGEFESAAVAAEVKLLIATLPLPDKKEVLEALEELTVADMRHCLASIMTPTLIVNGDQDRVCLPRASQYLKEHIGNAKQTIFLCCGHAPFLSRSHEFNAELVRFVRSVCETNT